MWLGLTSTQRHTRELNLGPRPAAKTRLLSFTRTQSRILAFLLDNLRRHRYIMGLTDSPLCMMCVAQKTSAHILRDCETLATHTHLSVFLFLGRWRCQKFNSGGNLNFIKGTGIPWLGLHSKGHKGGFKGLCASGPKGLKPIICSILFYSTQEVTTQRMFVYVVI